MATKQHCSYAIAWLFILLSLTPQIQCRQQAHVLSRLYKAKRQAGSSVDTSHFEAVRNLKPSRFGVDPNQQESKEKDRIGRLPGQPKVDFAQYGGYVTVDESAGRAFYYYFVQSTNSSGSSPLLLWLNGGPGCSSLAYGAMQELGPFRVHSDGRTLFRNRYSWNNAANVLFVESPAGVGFSYTNTTSDLKKLGDRITAADNYVFLVNWLERFPEYKGRDFYIAGESYAGHYVPQLAHTILLHNKNTNRSIINLKGIMIGNAVIHDETDVIGMYDYFETHALISEDTLQRLKKSCDFSSTPMGTESSEECTAASNSVETDTYYLDIYNLYAPLCQNANLTARPKKATITEFDPCSDNYVHAYLNRADVQAALHANVTKLPYDWEACSGIIKWNDSPSSIIPLLREFISAGLPLWVFSGDIDGRVPVTSTKYSLKKMNLTTATPWHPWYLGGEVGGYTEEYEGKVTFATVRGAGHQVPSFKPKPSLSLFIHFLNGTPLPDTTRYDLS